MGKKLLFTLVLLIIAIPTAMACDYTTQVELNKLASNVNAHYTVAEEPDVYFFINIYNLQEDLYAEVTSSLDNEVQRFDWTEENQGNITFESFTIYEKVDWTVKIYAKETSCEGKLLRTVHIITPKYNPYYGQYVCEDVPEFSLCQKWVDVDYTFDEMKTRVDNYKISLEEGEEKPTEPTEEEKGFFESIKDFVSENYIYILSGVGVVVIAIIVIVIIIRKRRVI